MARENYSAATRERILLAANQVFSEAGYDGASIRRIVDKAGTKIASVNYHFGSKEALYQAVLDAAFSQLTRNLEFMSVEPDDEDNPRARIRAVAKRRILDGLSARTFAPPRLMGWEIVAPKLGMRAIMREKLVAAEKPLLLLLEPLFLPETTPSQKSVAARWFLAATLPPPPVVLAVVDQLEPGKSDAALDAAATRLADAAVAGVTALAKAGSGTD